MQLYLKGGEHRDPGEQVLVHGPFLVGRVGDQAFERVPVHGPQRSVGLGDDRRGPGLVVHEGEFAEEPAVLVGPDLLRPRAVLRLLHVDAELAAEEGI